MICKRCGGSVGEKILSLEYIKSICDILDIPEYFSGVNREILEMAILISYDCFICHDCNFNHLIKKPEYSDKTTDEIFETAYGKYFSSEFYDL